LHHAPRYLSGLVPGIEPTGTDQTNEDLAFGKPFAQYGGELRTGAHVDVDKDIAAAELAFHVLTDAERIGGAVVASIADEDFAPPCPHRHARLRCSIAPGFGIVMGGV
jgi:hypothetical protein